MIRLLPALLAFLLLAAPAQASFTVTPSTLQAGSPANVVIHADFASTPQHVVLHLPPGLVGNPSAAGQCPVADFNSLLGCGLMHADSVVGSASANGLPLGTVYNLAPGADEPARLGIDLIGLVKNEAAVSLRPDGGLDSTIAPLKTNGIPVSSLDLTLNSTFMTLPTSCLPATTTIDADTLQSATFTPTGCASEPFAPGLAAEVNPTQRVAPTQATVTLSLPAGNSHVRRAEIALPVGTTLSPGVADGLVACTADQFAAVACPAASQVGTVSFDTPLLGVLGGKVFFGDGFRLYIVVQGHGVTVALPGDVKLDPATGQITTVFDNLPQVPFTSFALTFQGGPHAVVANPAACGTHTVSALLTPWSGTAPQTATATFAIDADGHGGACTAAALAPALRVSAGSTAAGRPAGPVTLEVSRPDGSQDISRVTTRLPPGLAGSLKGVPVCPEANADAGTCPADSRVGSVSALAGSGDAPVALNGTVSLTGPTDGGLAGLAIALPGKVGPVDLGTVAVRASIALRPDGGLDVRTRPLPHFIGGVPVSIRSLALTLDRPGFVLNSSSCAAQQVTAVIEGADGGTASVAAPYQATDCAGLAFKPKLTAIVGARGHTGRDASAPLHAVITVPAGQSSTERADVGLPSVIGLDLNKLAQACLPDAYAAGTCPAASRIGSAVATTPLLAAPLKSPVTFAVPALGSLPGLALRLTGPVTLPLFGNVALPGADKRIHNVFAGIPDVPLGRFDLTFTSASPLQLQRSICSGARQRVIATLTGHNGAVTKLSTPMKVAGCPPVVALVLRGHKLSVNVTRGRDGAKLKKITLGGRTVKGRQTLTLKRLPGSKKLHVVVKDALKRTWTFHVRAKKRR